MRVLILGGDGYLGWPTAMHLSARGHMVMVADNYLRRNLCQETDSDALFPVPNLHERARIWHEKSEKEIEVRIGDLREWPFISRTFDEFLPEAVVHYAEQPSAPYSMLSRESSMLTLTNNIEVTANVIHAVKQFTPDTHIVKLGTMGEYGTPNIDIEEGWLDVEHKGRSQRFLYPRQAGSLYHTTKVMDTDLLWFYVRNWGFRVTDLMQGPVYGLDTDESAEDERLVPFFNYDDLFGTVLNRFIAQAVVGYPLTVYGAGGQTRGYLNIRDTLQCIRLSLETPAEPGDLRIFNQFVETFSVNSLAEKVSSAAKSLGFDVEVQSIENPRIERELHYYNPAHTGLLELGLHPHYLTEETLMRMLERVGRYRSEIRTHRIFRGVKWN